MSRAMEELRGYFAVHSQGLGHATRAVAPACGLLDRRRDLYLLSLAGSPALDLVVANGFDALTMPPAPDWEATDGVLGPVWRWYRDYGRYLRVARRFLEGETDWDYYRFLLSDSELASAREAIRHRIPTAFILDATRHNFARDPVSRLVEGPANFWASRIARGADFILAADLVITTAGKGTVNEALAAGTPVIAIPPKGHAEAERNAATLGYRFEDLRRLKELIPQKLALGRLPPKPMGNEQAIGFLIEFLDRVPNR